MKKFINSLLFFSLALFANQNIQNMQTSKLEIYQNGSFLTKEVLKKKEGDFQAVLKLPYDVSLKDVEIEESKGCFVKDSLLKEAEGDEDEVAKKIEELERKISFLDNKIRSLKENADLLRSVSLNAVKGDFEDLKNIVEFQLSKMEDNLNRITLLTKERSGLLKELDELKKQKKYKSYKNLILDIKCDKDSSSKTAVRVRYPFAVEKRLSYGIYGDTLKKRVFIESRLFLLNSGWEDLENLTVIYASYPKRGQISPSPFYPWYVDLYPSRGGLAAVKRKSFADKTAEAMPAPSLNFKISYNKNKNNEFYKIENVTLKRGKENSFVLAKDEYKADFFVEISGYSFARAFFAFVFDSSKFYNPAEAKFYLNDSFVGRKYFSVSEKGENKLYFGEDLNMKVKKEVIKDFKEKPLFSSNKVRTTKIYRYKIKNDHDFKVKTVLTERAPISKNEKVEIRIISDPPYTNMEPNGKTVFEFTLSPKEEKEIKFGYEIEKPKM